MIRGLVDFALNNRWLVLGFAVLLFAWGIVSFHNLPVEAYPDVANNYVEIITQWPGRAAEEVEQQVTSRSRSRWPAFRTCSICARSRWPAFPTSS
jgi:cobalt-zinc-cadmium resistance protein CzcA